MRNATCTTLFILFLMVLGGCADESFQPLEQDPDSAPKKLSQLDDYTPPPMFGKNTASRPSADLEPQPAIFSPDDTEEPEKISKKGLTFGESIDDKGKKSSSEAEATFEPARRKRSVEETTVISQPKEIVRKIPPPAPKVAVPASLELEVNQLVKPTAKDVLASINNTAAPAPGKQPITTSYAQPQVQRKISLVFTPDETILTKDMKLAMLKNIVDPVRGTQGPWLQIYTYSSLIRSDEKMGRRISLVRAVAVRDFLEAAGVENAKIDIRPSETSHDSSMPDRVDVVIHDK